MSVRPTPRTTSISAPSEAIEFKNDFVNSTAALTASHDETVSHILQRLDQLQSKISNQPEADIKPVAQLAAAARPLVGQKPTGDLHSRLQTLETIHEGSLKTLNSKLDGLERQITNNKEAEVLMGRISSKFGAIESQLGANKEANALMDKIATKFTQVESRLQSATQLGDRVAQLESRFQIQSKLQDRVQALESQLKTSVQPKLYDLESRLEPGPEHDRILARINSKLDILEQNSKNKAAAKSVSLGAAFDQEEGRRKVESREDDAAFTGSNADREERIKFLQSRIERLKELRSRYEDTP